MFSASIMNLKNMVSISKNNSNFFTNKNLSFFSEKNIVPRDFKQFMSGSSSAAINAIDMNRVVFVGMRGLSTGDSEGVGSFVDYMRARMASYGVPGSNLYSTKWHHSDSGTDPETERHWREVEERNTNPILYIVGHSLGGWSAARLANKARENGADVRFVGLIDARYNINRPGDPFKVHANYVANWYQKKGTSVLSYCAKSMSGSFKGHHDPQANFNEEISHKHIWNGDNDVKIDKEHCDWPIGTVEKYTSHIDIDDDKKVWLSIRSHILNDLNILTQTPIINQPTDEKPLVKGSASIIESAGQPGNFEVVVPLLNGGLGHFWRDNTNFNFNWSGVTPFAGNKNFDSASVVQFKADGNLCAVAISENQLFFVYRDPQGSWSPIVKVADGVKGSASIIESTGQPGNFEVVVPLLNGGLGHFWRDNTNFNWSGVTPFAGNKNFDSASVVQFKADGNLCAVAISSAALFFYYRETNTGNWIENTLVSGAFPKAVNLSNNALAPSPTAGSFFPSRRENEELATTNISLSASL